MENETKKRVVPPYDEKAKKRTLKYRKAKQHPVTIAYRTEEFEERIKPAIQRSGMSVATFFKQAVDEKIQRDQLQ